MKSRLLFICVLIALCFFTSCGEKDNSSSENSSVVDYDIEYSFVGNGTVGHFFEGVATYLDVDQNVICEQTFSSLPWKITFNHIGSPKGQLMVTLRYKSGVDTIHYDAWAHIDTVNEQQVKSLVLDPSSHIVSYANYSDGKRLLSKRRDTDPSTHYWQVSGPGTNVSFAEILFRINNHDPLSL